MTERIKTTVILDYLRKGLALDDEHISQIHKQIMNDHFIVNALICNLDIKKFWKSQGRTEYDNEIQFSESLLGGLQKQDSVK